ncbi:MAG: polyphosphate kinase 1 [Bacteroidota bacterium]
MPHRKLPLINRDISWLSFNERVLQEAQDSTVPLLERLRFLGINSSNRDEFFRVRVATIRRMVNYGRKGEELLGANPKKLLKSIQKLVLKQQNDFERTYTNLIAELGKQGIHLINEQQLTVSQGEFVRKYFREQVQSHIVPIMINTAPKFPYLKDKSIYLAIKLTSRGKDAKPIYSILEVPTDVVSRFLVLPNDGNSTRVILLDDVIRYCLDDIFQVIRYAVAKAYTIKIIRDAELDFDSDVSKSWMEKVEKSVKQRKKGTPVRLIHDKQIPRDLLSFIVRKMKLSKSEQLTPGGRYHNIKDFISFPSVGGSHLLYKPTPPVEHPDLIAQRSLFEVIRSKDVLLSYPHHTFNHIIDLLREASIDPKVQSIQITLYRASLQSSIINALINAVKNGKHVTAVVELRARFDEETNISHANRLQEEGAHVIFGVPGLKVHSKLFLITRKEEGRSVLYAHIGTGNFNEQTARLYTDHSLLTVDRRISREVERLFDFYRDNYKTGNYKNLIVSPFNTRKRFLKMIDQEIENVSAGKAAWIILKMNSLVDKEMISRLYDAGKAGVRIWLIVRGICSLEPDHPDWSENIKVISIIDRYLEHSRIFVFCNGGVERCYLSSGDWMYRNLDHRSEVAVPVFDEQIKQQLIKYLELQLNDNVKARSIDSHSTNRHITANSKRRHRSQAEIYAWLKAESDLVASKRTTNR